MSDPVERLTPTQYELASVELQPIWNEQGGLESIEATGYIRVRSDTGQLIGNDTQGPLIVPEQLEQDIKAWIAGLLTAYEQQTGWALYIPRTGE